MRVTRGSKEREGREGGGGGGEGEDVIMAGQTNEQQGNIGLVSRLKLEG